MSSKARNAFGAKLSINTSGTVWTEVGELTSIKGSGRKADTEEVTNFDSTAREYIPVIPDPGEMAIEGNWVPDDPGQMALDTAFSTNTLVNFKIEMPKRSTQTTTGDVITFAAYVTELDPIDLAPTKASKLTGKLKVTGSIIFTLGS